MRRNKYSLICFKLIFVLLLLQSCVVGDSNEELSGDYFYRDNGINSKEIISHLPNRKNIYSNVISYSYNKDFILVAQKPNLDGYRNSISFELRDDIKKYPLNSSEDIQKTLKISDSLISNNIFYKNIFSRSINFWIIANKSNQFFGPMSLENYIEKRRSLNIPEKLTIKLKI
jgi:hypothetical protein